MKKNSSLSILLNGILKENPVLVLILGTCPTLATTTNVFGAFGMGIAATFVLIGSNAVISLLKKIIPDKVRIPCYIVVIATFVTIVEMLLHAFVPAIYDALGIFLPEDGNTSTLREYERCDLGIVLQIRIKFEVC